MKYFTKFMLVIILTLIFMPACKRRYTTHHEYLSVEEQDWMYFKKGTYWIYKDTYNGLTDTQNVILDSIRHSYREDTDWDERHTYQITRTDRYYVIESSYENTTYVHKAYGSDQTDNIWDFRAYHSFDIDRQSKKSVILILDTISGTIIDESALGNIITLTNTYDSLLVGEEYFYDVVRIRETGNDMVDGKETVVYFAKGVGIIRSQILHNNGWQIWDLHEYNIIQ